MKVITFLIILICVPIIFTNTNITRIQCDLTEVWGPGLDPENVIMPARYFFIQAVSKNNSKMKESPGKNTFTVKILGEKQPCRVRIDVLDRQDGSFIVRYKVYEMCSNLVISVQCLEKELPRFPYNFKNPVYPEECSCHVADNVEDWLRKFGCKKHHPQIESDLKNFDVIDFNDIHPAAEKQLFNNPNKHSVCNYVIRDNQIHRTCYGKYTGFKMFMDAILLFITRRVRLPDLEMLVNLGDWPLIKDKISISGKQILVPIFSWCGSEETLDIVLPTYDITESSLENLGRISLDMLSVQGNTGPPWKDKIPKLFWRGRDSSRERLKLISVGRQHQTLINASLTNFFFFRDVETEYGPKVDRVSFFEFFKYKYQMNMDGTVAAYRFPYLLVGDSLIFKQDSPYYEHFYKDLKKWKHFVPVKKDLSDLVEKLEWASTHDEEAHNIAINGQVYARENLLPQNVFCYHVLLLHAYSQKLVNSNITIRSGMELVSQSSNNLCNCSPISLNNFETTSREDL